MNILGMCDKKCHFVDEHDVNFKHHTLMNREQFRRHRMGSSVNMRIRPMHSFSFDGAQIWPIYIVSSLKIGCFNWTTLQQREQFLDELCGGGPHGNILDATCLLGAQYLSTGVLVLAVTNRLNHGPVVIVITHESVCRGLIKTTPARFKFDSAVTVVCM